jgi:hypothetical protein
VAKVCPCIGCVPPKRHQTCHSICSEYREWEIEKNIAKDKKNEAKQFEADCFPPRYRKHSAGRRLK